MLKVYCVLSHCNYEFDNGGEAWNTELVKVFATESKALTFMKKLESQIRNEQEDQVSMEEMFVE